MSNRIKDGVFIAAQVRAVPDLHDDLTFCYSPMLSRDNAALERRMERFSDGEAAADFHCAEIAKRIRWWSEMEDGAPLKISGPNLSTFAPRLVEMVAAIVQGKIPPGTPDKISEGWVLGQKWITENGGGLNKVVEAISGN